MMAGLSLDGPVPEQSHVEIKTMAVPSGGGRDTLVVEQKGKEDGLGLELGLVSGSLFEDGDEGLCVLDSAKKMEDGIGKISEQKNNVTDSLGDDSNAKMAFDENGISLIVDVHGPSESVNGSEKESVGRDLKGPSTNSGEALTVKYAQNANSTPKAEEKEINVAEGGSDDGIDVGNEEDGANDDDMDAEDQFVYSMGDFVWGKTSGGTWLPGRICDPSDAEHEGKHRLKQIGRYLVVHFGDSSFSWSTPFQLKPFTENFGSMSKQSDSKSFIKAVQKALDEFGRCVESVMICSCVPAASETRLVHKKLASHRYEPSELIASLRYLAKLDSVANMLDVMQLKGWLSAFYNVRRNHSLPTFQEPVFIEGLEDTERNENLGSGYSGVAVEVPIQGPSEDWLYLPGSSENGPDTQKEKLDQRCKRKSIAELMKKEAGEEKSTRRAKRSVRLTSEKNIKSNGEAGGDDFAALTSSGRTKRRKKADVSQHDKSTGDKELRVETGKNGGGAGADEKPSSRKRKRRELSDIETDGLKDMEYASSPRERKKSKYLCPPYTSLKWISRDSSYKKDVESEKIGKAAGQQQFVSIPVMRCGTKALKKSRSEECDSGSPTSPESGEQDHKGIFESIDVNASVGQVLSEVHSAAVNPVLRGGPQVFREFLLAFRSAVYVNPPAFT